MTDLTYKLENHIWPRVERPARYTGNEFGVKSQANVNAAGVRVALAYPDLYDVGMSNLGIRILAAVASGAGAALVDRVFLPWPDMQKLMREEAVPLYGLESLLPVKEFDLFGITLQSELTYTNILSMLDLAGVPLHGKDRGEDDPLVCAGGPCAINPVVTAPFFDFFVFGDGEDSFTEVVSSLIDMKADGVSRQEKLARINALRNVWVPAFGTEGVTVSVGRCLDLDRVATPDPLPVPLIEVAQHHYPVEIMRGCTCGCRFCQAGMYYRPVRVRSVEKIIDLSRRAVREGGWRSVSLLSLSSADYPAIERLVEVLGPELHGAGVQMSLPSLRVDERTLGILEKVSGGRKGGLTFAVEAGSQRLRNVVGKKVDEEQLYEMVEKAFREGWTMVKLYFMIGLPTETYRDLDDIARLIDAVAAIGKRIRGKHNINVSISPFVPKPGTPFQREAQLDPEELWQRVSHVRKNIRFKSVKISWHDPRGSIIEGALARGDGRVSAVLEEAWREGAQFDGWQEYFDFAIWEKAFAAKGLSWQELIAERPDGSKLPWDFIELPANNNFLDSQRGKAVAGENVEDCRDGACLACGADKASNCAAYRKLPGENEFSEEPLSVGELPIVLENTEPRKWRMKYAKRGRLRFIGHLDLMRMIEFILRRSGLPVMHSAGFNPRMRLSFSPPLSLGIESIAEFIDFETTDNISLNEIENALRKSAAGLAGFEIIEIAPAAPGKKHRLAHEVTHADYLAHIPVELAAKHGVDKASLDEVIKQLKNSGSQIEWTDRKGRVQTRNLAPTLENIKVESGGKNSLAVSYSMALEGDESCRWQVLFARLLGVPADSVYGIGLTKKDAYRLENDKKRDPLKSVTVY